MGFSLEIVSMDGLVFQGEVERVRFRSIAGDVAILNHHTNYCTAVGMGTACVHMMDGTERAGACNGGMVSMMDNKCRLIPDTWEWEDEIDVARAEEAQKKAEERLKDSSLSDVGRRKALAKLRRAQIRLQTAAYHK